MAKFELLILGTGSPLPSGDRCGAGNVLLGEESTVLIDCGWGAARRLIASGVPLGSIDTLFFTHMHSDHITDLPDFMMMRWTAGGAKKPLTVYGPEGTREAVEGFRNALNPDVRYRVAHHGDKLSMDGIQVIVNEIPATPDPNHVATSGDLEVASFEVDHRPVEPALGFTVTWRGHTAVFSGDTRKVDSLVRASKGADVLVSEAVHLGMMQDRINFMRARNDERTAEILVEACDYHAPTLDVADMAREAGVGRLLLSHLIPPIPTSGPQVEQFVAGMSDIYKGEIKVCSDLERFVIAEA
jgi:ribonuclease Z